MARMWRPSWRLICSLADKEIGDLIARLDDQDQRVERLETLEFGTLAFPSGGGFSLICDVIVAAPTATVTLCPAGTIPTSFLHLFAILEMFSDVEQPSVPDKIEININGDFATNYASYVRQELPLGVPVGAPDTDVGSPFGIGATDTKWFGPRPGSFSVFAANSPTVFFALFPSYVRPLVDDLHLSFCWFGFSNFLNTAPGTPNNFSADQGGGSYFETAPMSITSIRFTHTGGGSFVSPSRFTLYGLP